MTDYPKLAPIVKSAFGAFEAETAEAQKAMEAEFSNASPRTKPRP